jgi:hypothetical protein
MFKVGTSNVIASYVGGVLFYSAGTPPPTGAVIDFRSIDNSTIEAGFELERCGVTVGGDPDGVFVLLGTSGPLPSYGSEIVETFTGQPFSLRYFKVIRALPDGDRVLSSSWFKTRPEHPPTNLVDVSGGEAPIVVGFTPPALIPDAYRVHFRFASGGVWGLVPSLVPARDSGGNPTTRVEVIPTIYGIDYEVRISSVSLDSQNRSADSGLSSVVTVHVDHPAIPALVAHFDASVSESVRSGSLPATDGDPVTEWRDLVGTRHITASGPTYVAASQNAMPGVRRLGATHSTLPIPFYSQPFGSVVVVMKQKAPGAGAFMGILGWLPLGLGGKLLDYGNNTTGRNIHSVGSWYVQGLGPFAHNTDNNLNRSHVDDARVYGISSDSVPYNDPNGVIYLGPNFTSSEYYYDADFLECRIYSEILTQPQMAYEMAQLTTKWALTPP